MTEDIRTDDAPAPALAALAEACGVADRYWSFFGDRVEVPAATLRADPARDGRRRATTDAEAEAALADAEDRPWRRLLPPSVVVRAGLGRAAGARRRRPRRVAVASSLEDGSWRDIPIPDQAARVAHGRRRHGVAACACRCPADLPLGLAHPARAGSAPRREPSADRTAACVARRDARAAWRRRRRARARRPGVGSDGAAVLGALARVVGRRRLRRPRRPGRDRRAARRRLPARQSRCTPRRSPRRSSRRRTCRRPGASSPRSTCVPRTSARRRISPPTTAIASVRAESRSRRAEHGRRSASTATRRGRPSARRSRSSSPRRGRPARQALARRLRRGGGAAARWTSRCGARSRSTIARLLGRRGAPRRGVRHRIAAGRGAARASSPTASRSMSGCSGSPTSRSPPRRRAAQGGGHAHRRHARPGGGVHHEGIGCLVAARHVRAGHHGGRAAGHVQPAGAGLEPAAVAAARARGEPGTRRCAT